MKKRNLTTLTIVAVLLVLLTLIAVSGTYAKYTTTITGSSTAVIAKWNFKASETTVGELSSTQTFTIDLADTATVGKVTVGEGDDAVNKIQPGSKGEIEITIDNTGSDVAATLNIEAKTIEGAKLSETQFDFSEPVIKVDGATATSVPAGKTGTAVVTWEWLYNADDAADNSVGKGTEATNGTPIQLIDLVVTGYQANPQGT